MDDTENTQVEEEVIDDAAQSEQADSTETESNTPTDGQVDTEEKLLAGKFKSPEELEKSYLELQSQFTKTRQAEKEQEEEAGYNPYTQPSTPSGIPDDVMQTLLMDDGSGMIDPRKMIAYTTEKAKEDIRREQRAAQFEQDDWNKAVKEYPQLADNPRLAELVKNNRLSMIVTGRGYKSYSSVAKEIISELTKSEQTGEEKGRTDAQVSEKIVSRASIIEPSNTQEPSTEEREKVELEQRMKSHDHGIAQQARQLYISKYM